MDMAAVGARLRDARKAAGMTQEQLSDALGIPRSGVSEIENGQRGLSASELVAASKALRRPLDYFVSPNLTPPPEGSGIFAVRFRMLSLQPVDAAAVFEFEQCCRAYAWLEKIMGVRALQPAPSYTTWPKPANDAEAVKQGEDLAESERNRLELGIDPVRDPFDVVESQGVRVFVRKLETGGVTGIFHFDEELGPCILVNAAVHPNRRCYDLLHEYCHFLVDRLEGVHWTAEVDDPSDLIERRANAFASAFLLPRKGVERFLADRGIVPGGDAPNFGDIGRLMVAFGASFRATIVRLKDLGYLDDRSANAYFRTPDITVWTDRFRRASGIPEPSFDDPAQRRFGQLVLRAYAKGEISLGRVAELLNVDRSEARQLAWLSRAKAGDVVDLAEAPE